jgi:hypothetical protein
VAGIWDKVRRMRELAGLPPRLQKWWEILSGVYNPFGQPGQLAIYDTQATPRDANHPTKPINERPWEILRACLLWFLWCQKCEFDLRDQNTFYNTLTIGIDIYEIHLKFISYLVFPFIIYILLQVNDF